MSRGKAYFDLSTNSPTMVRKINAAFSERDVILMSSTLGHQTGYLYGYCLNFLLGATAVWLDIWNAAEAARLIESERVTFTMGATPFLQDLTYAPTSSDLSSLRVFISAGASIPRRVRASATASDSAARSPGGSITRVSTPAPSARARAATPGRSDRTTAMCGRITGSSSSACRFVPEPDTSTATRPPMEGPC